MRIDWTRLLKLSAISLLGLFVAGNVALAWFFVGALTRPNCLRNRVPPSEFPSPVEKWLQTSDGLSIRVWYYPSQNGAAVIAMGGTTGSLGELLPPVEPLLKAGYGVLQIDSRVCANPPAPVTLGYHEINDAAAGLSYILSRPDVDPKRIGIFGFSMGGVSAIRMAARYSEIEAVLAEGGYYNLGDDLVEMGSQQDVFQKVFLYTIAGVFWLRTGVNPWDSSPVDDLPRISPRHVFLVYGEHEAISGKAQLQFSSAGEPKSIWIVPDGSHGRNHIVAPGEYERRVLEFFDQSLIEAP